MLGLANTPLRLLMNEKKINSSADWFLTGDFNMVETAEEKGFSNPIRPQIHIIMASFYREVDSLPNRGICYAHPVFFFCFVCIV